MLMSGKRISSHPIRLDVHVCTQYNTHTQQHNTHMQGNAMITINNATVETLDQHDARPIGKTVLCVTIGDHTFDMLVDEDELIKALASQYK